MRGKMPHFLEWLLSISSRVFFLYFRSNVLSNSAPVFQLTLLLLKKLTLKMNLKKMFENSSGLHMKRCRFLKRRAVKIFNRVLQKRCIFAIGNYYKSLWWGLPFCVKGKTNLPFTRKFVEKEQVFYSWLCGESPYF